MIVPKRHVADYFKLSQHEKTACWIMADRVQTQLKNRFHPEGYKLSVEAGSMTSQSIPHTCIHLILHNCDFDEIRVQ
jgi:ATP adenylyltransferase